MNDDPEKIVEIINELKPTHIIDLMGQGMVAQVGMILSFGIVQIYQKSPFIEAIRKLENREICSCKYS